MNTPRLCLQYRSSRAWLNQMYREGGSKFKRFLNCGGNIKNWTAGRASDANGISAIICTWCTSRGGRRRGAAKGPNDAN